MLPYLTVVSSTMQQPQGSDQKGRGPLKNANQQQPDPQSSFSSRGTDASTPQPPGFLSANSSDHMLYDGEALRGEGGTLSAPPPPGFNASQEERARIANQAIWNNYPNAAAASTNGGGGVDSIDWNLMDSRTTSFTNLAAMVGTGLAESMEDSTRGAGGGDGMYGLSYARQTRHAASRLIGGGSGLSPTAALLDLGIALPRNDSSSAGLKNSRIPSEHAASMLHRSSSNGSRESSTGGAPATLAPYASDNDPLVDFRASVQHRGTQQNPPLGIFNSNPNHGTRMVNNRPGTDVGVTVMEPDLGRNSAPPQLFGGEPSGTLSGGGTPGSSQHGTPVISRQGTPDISELQRGIQTMNVADHRSVQSEMSQHSASEQELEPFFWDANSQYSEPSRALAILRAPGLPAPEIRSTCEAFGVLEVFRADFADRGIIFVGYYDIRSAQYAAVELKQCLRRLATSAVDLDVEVKYCVPLNSSSAHDESVIVLSDLPHQVKEQSLTTMLSSYGSLRSLNLLGGGHYGGKTYVVEFHNVQDAKLALLELDSTQPWGPDVVAEVGARRAVERKRGRELLGVIGKWRHGNSGRQLQQQMSSLQRASSHGTPGAYAPQALRTGQPVPSSLRLSERTEDSHSLGTQEPNTGYRSNEPDSSSTSTLSQQTTQLVLGPDGRYSYVLVNHSAYPHRQAPAQNHHPHHVDHHSAGVRVLHQPQVSHQQQHVVSHTQQVVHGPHGTYLASVPAAQSHVTQQQQQQQQQYWNHAPQQQQQPHQQQQAHHHHQQQHQQQYQTIAGQTIASNAAYSDNGAVYTQSASSANMPYYAHVVNNTTGDSSVSSGSNSQPVTIVQARRPAPAVDEKDNRHLTLDIDAVDAGRDTRTSLMVRNIPNKYTQQMLLSEFTDNGHGPGKIDFFYLPIDFKNKCNRGYAFINFVDFRDIVSFHRQYFGQHWRVFNSDKICDITYARIQGKAGMLKRFENSALMEKDEEYKPLVFGSHGPDKGKHLPFPAGRT